MSSPGGRVSASRPLSDERISRFSSSNAAYDKLRRQVLETIGSSRPLPKQLVPVHAPWENIERYRMLEDDEDVDAVARDIAASISPEKRVSLPPTTPPRMAVPSLSPMQRLFSPTPGVEKPTFRWAGSPMT